MCDALMNSGPRGPECAIHSYCITPLAGVETTCYCMAYVRAFVQAYAYVFVYAYVYV